jgi:NIMA-interacting peptidyl-prolyl cis-trans isomerase 4
MSSYPLFSKGGAASGSDSADKKSQGPKGGGNAVKVSYLMCLLFSM